MYKVTEDSKHIHKYMVKRGYYGCGVVPRTLG